MFLQLAHKQMDIYVVSKSFIIACYKLTTTFPPQERFNMTQQIRRAALSVQLNIAEGSSRRSETERKRFYEIARGSIIEIDAAIDIAIELEYINKMEITELGELMIRCFQMLTKLIKHQIS
jgi:four helix bundle protein